jgi:hypothetical protein
MHFDLSHLAYFICMILLKQCGGVACPDEMFLDCVANTLDAWACRFCK